MMTARQLLAASVAAAFTSIASAQPAASAPSIAASAAPTAKPEKRALSPAELRDSATTPGDLRPERRVTPQLSIPLNQNSPPKPALVPAPRATNAPSGGIDDSAARCAALADAQAREACRAKIAR
jgi:hypothetical protein